MEYERLEEPLQTTALELLRVADLVGLDLPIWLDKEEVGILSVRTYQQPQFKSH